jgi:hypothetical protein
MINYLIITGIVLLVLVIIKLFISAFVKEKKPRSVVDELMNIPKFREMKGLYDAMHALNEAEGGTDQDIIPEGFGEFGYDVTNPIPVNTVFGNTAYLGKLRTLDGVKIRYERLGSTRAENINYPIDIYNIFRGEEKIATLYISPYNKKNSGIAPKGFNLLKLEGLS